MIGMFTTRSRIVGIALALTLGGTILNAPARGAEPVLRWKFTEGESMHYQMVQKTTTKVKGPNQDIRTTVSQTIDTTWNVLSVDRETGIGTLTQTIDQVRTKIEYPFGQFEYDSKSEKAPEGPMAAGIVPTLKALVGSKFQYKMTPQGELSDVKVPESLVKTLKEAGPNASGVSMFSEEGLKNMIQESSLLLPRDAEPGKPWTRQTKIPSPPIGTMMLDKTYTYTGPDAQGDKITLDVKLGLEPDPKSNLDIKVVNQDGKGTFYFDSKAGRVTSSTVTEKIDLLIKVMTAEINQSSDMSTTMTLLDAK